MTCQKPWTCESPPAYHSVVDPGLPGRQDSYSGSASPRSSPRDSCRPNHAPYSNERDPLFRPTINHSRKGSSCKHQALLIIVIIFAFILAPLYLYERLRRPIGEIDPIERERQHREWEREWREHQREHEEWDRDRKERERERERQRNRQREEEERRRIEEENRRWREEQQRRERERKRQEQERRDEEERQRQNLYWDELTPAAHCASYGAREYTARLRNVPVFYDRVKACKTTPIVIHDRIIKTPDKCEDRGIWGGMHGVWLVRYNEMACLPIWGDFVDKGCTAEGSRLQRIESRLWNIQSGEDWKQMCATTPADLHGKHFDSPKNCDDRGIWGIFGVWELEDPNC